MEVPTEETIIRFYLGNTTEEEEVEIALSTLDDEFMEEMEMIENDVVSNYLRGYLTEEEKKDFEDNYMVTEGRILNVLVTAEILEKLKSYSAKNDSK